jgi:hypothetical protein
VQRAVEIDDGEAIVHLVALLGGLAERRSPPPRSVMAAD